MGQHPKIQHFLIQSIIKIKNYRIIHILSNISQRILLIFIFIWNHVVSLKNIFLTLIWWQFSNVDSFLSIISWLSPQPSAQAQSVDPCSCPSSPRFDRHSTSTASPSENFIHQKILDAFSCIVSIWKYL